VDAAGNLYVADDANGRVQKRDARGDWSVVATYGSAPGQVRYPSGLAVDGAGNLYVADIGNDRVQKYTPAP
jgi:DNA-binding beta-propeller fold protein YncE